MSSPRQNQNSMPMTKKTLKTKLFLLKSITFRLEMHQLTQICQISEICMCILKRAKVLIQDILQFYAVCVRPILEYASSEETDIQRHTG